MAQAHTASVALGELAASYRVADPRNRRWAWDCCAVCFLLLALSFHANFKRNSSILPCFCFKAQDDSLAAVFFFEDSFNSAGRCHGLGVATLGVQIMGSGFVSLLLFWGGGGQAAEMIHKSESVKPKCCNWDFGEGGLRSLETIPVQLIFRRPSVGTPLEGAMASTTWGSRN